MAAYIPQCACQVPNPELAVGTALDTETTSEPPVRRGTAGRDLQSLFAQAGLSNDLQRVEALLLERTRSRQADLAGSGKRMVQAGGKRLRAALVLLTARLADYQFERVLHPAASAELIHVASLVHDDLVDRAARRRGQETVHSRWGNDVALMLGDYFFALAAAEMALSPDQRIIRFYADAVQIIVEGELSPVTMVIPLEAALQQYLFKIGSKTAALFEAACKAGMTAGGGSEADIAALGRFGYDLGMAFQIVDDVLDFTGNEQHLGKPAGNDLLQGTITLPLIYAADANDSPLLHMVVEQFPLASEQVPAIVEAVIAAGGVARARAKANYFARRALTHLASFVDQPAYHTLTDLTGFVIERQM